MSENTYHIQIKLPNNGEVKIVIKAASEQQARQLAELQYGKDNIKYVYG